MIRVCVASSASWAKWSSKFLLSFFYNNWFDIFDSLWIGFLCSGFRSSCLAYVQSIFHLSPFSYESKVFSWDKRFVMAFLYNPYHWAETHCILLFAQYICAALRVNLTFDQMVIWSYISPTVCLNIMWWGPKCLVGANVVYLILCSCVLSRKLRWFQIDTSTVWGILDYKAL